MAHLISLLPLTFLNILASTLYAQSQNTTMNTIDSCWRSNPNWSTNRQTLANCVAGFGGATTGGKNGPIYVVTDPSDDPQNPKQGTLRYGAAQGSPLWIMFASDMSIALKSVLRVSGSKTVDGRGAKIKIGNGPCMELRGVKNVIVHGIMFSGCKGEREGLGDAITVIGSSDVWIDHCFFSRSGDGLIDVVQGSSDVTISNNHFTQHDKVMLLGNDDNHTPDKDMRVTVAFNYFGAGLGQRMPRVRHGYAHVANNRFERWQNYAIGGSANPTIFSEGNYFIAANSKEVTERHNVGGDEWKNWTWKSSRDVFQNGAFFTQSGSGSYTPNYSLSQSFTIAHGSSVPTLTSSAGPLQCTPNKTC